MLSTHTHQVYEKPGHSLSSTTQLSLTVDTAIRIVLHSAKVAHFTHKTRGTSVSSTTRGILHTRGKHPNNAFHLTTLNKESTRLVHSPHDVHHTSLAPDRTIHEGTNGVPGLCKNSPWSPYLARPHIKRVTLALSPLVMRDLF